MLVSNCFNTITVVRQSTTTQDSTPIVSSINISSQPKIATALSFKFSAKCTGVITITGTVNGSSTTEEVSVNNNTIAQSMKRFSNVSTVSFDSDLVDTGEEVSIKYIDMGGSSVPIESDLIDDFPINLTRDKSSLAIDNEGSVQYELMKGLIPYTNLYTPQEFDLITIKETSEKFIVIGSPRIEQVGINQHYVCNLKRFER